MSAAVSFDDRRKATATVFARLALAGYSCCRIRGAGYQVSRGAGWSIDLPSLEEVAAFAERVDGLQEVSDANR